MSKMGLEVRQEIVGALAGFGAGELAQQATRLFNVLGYHSEKRLTLEPPTAATFAQFFGAPKADKALIDDWRSVEMVFQLTDAEIRASAQLGLFDSSTQYAGAIIESYLIFALQLSGESYTRTQLAEVTREINRLFAMPVLIVFQHGELITLAMINRRLNKKDSSRDVLEKVTLIKDIRTANPHRAHVDILADLALEALAQRHAIRNFVDLQRAWQITLDSAELNKRFFREIANWYFWATTKVEFPADAQPDRDVRNATSVIRLLTRLIFVWFLREKGLVPEELFNEQQAQKLLAGDDPSRYYKAILQNLFFATLNQEMDKRSFRRDGQNFNITTLYRYKPLFADPDAAVALFATIPFLNGGLFECLDKKDEADKVVRVDGFSDHAKNPLLVPDELFWGPRQRDDSLNAIYATKGKRYEVRGLIHILNGYKFTITENTPIEEEIALDPELLGKVFENLLAAYNPETGATARKQTGSFYTPREIVNYMVDEALIAQLAQALDQADDAEPRLRQLFGYHAEPHQFSDPEIRQLIAAIDALAILDPACGSGAFPMGILGRLVFILTKLDPKNKRWKDTQLRKANQLSDSTFRDQTIEDIEQAFERNELDYGRKLFLIENSIYGVDIQPVAVQIARLRCYIALIVDQRVDDQRPNRGVRLLPNLETRFVAANSLLDVLGTQIGLRSPAIKDLEDDLTQVRRHHFTAKTQPTKQKYRDLDRKLRGAISRLLQDDGLAAEKAAILAAWDPYDQNRSASFFNLEWMFGRDQGFDVLIGNPPYVRQEQIKEQKEALKAQFDSYTGVADLYVYFYERGLQLLRDGGVLCYISSNKWLRAGYGEKLRKFLATNSHVREMIDFGELPVFEAATFPMIFLAQRGATTDQFIRFTQVKSLAEPYPNIPELVAAQGIHLQPAAIRGADWTLSSAGVTTIIRLMEQRGIPLERYVDGKIYYGVKTGFNEAFVINGATRAALIAADANSAEIIKPLAVGDDVRRWTIRDKDRWLIVTKIGVDIKNYPEIFKHLQQWQSQLEKRQDKGDHWWELRSCAYYNEFDKPKIIYPEIAKEARFAFDNNGLFVNNKVFFITGHDLYLLGILNSTIAWTYTKTVCSVLGDENKGGRVMLQWVNFKHLPIPKASASVERLIETLVEYVLYLTSVVGEGPEAGAGLMAAAQDSYMLGYFERLIDGLVYELYFPAELHAADCHLAAPLLGAELPSLASLGSQPLPGLRALNQRIYEPQHPVRLNLFFLDSIDVVRTIEGKQ